MSSVDYFTTVLSKLAYAKNETQLLCRTLCVPTWLQIRGPFSEKKTYGTQGTAVYRTLFD